MAVNDGRSSSAQQAFDEAINRHFDSASISVGLASARSSARQPDFHSLEMTMSLANRFRETVQTFCRVQREDQKTVREYSVDQNPGDYFAQYVDLSHYPEAESRISSLLAPGNLVPFRDEGGFVKHLQFYAIVAQFDDQTVIGLRSITPAQKPHYGKWSVKAVWNEVLGRYDELTSDPFLFDNEIDCLLYKNFVFISNRSKFEKIFNFYQVRRSVAERALSVLERDLQIHNFEKFKEACLRDPRKQTRLAHIANATDLSHFTIASARRVIAANSQLGSIVVTESGEEVLAYNTEHPWALLRFLGETTVSSLVTRRNFETDDKRPL